MSAWEKRPMKYVYVILLGACLNGSMPTGSALAQFGGFGAPGAGTGGAGGGLANQFGGIVIDPEGILRDAPLKPMQASQAKRLRQQFAEERLSAELIVETPLRVFSLRNLEADLLRLTSAGEPIPAELLLLGGIHRLEYVLFDAERNDILIAGPAEGFAPAMEGGRLVGLTSGRPPLLLEDLLVALRANAQGQTWLGCSIDPTEENTARLQRYIQANSTPVTPQVAGERYRQMGLVLGNQVVTVWGVPANSHFALTLVHADYRMKRIALGTEPSGVRQVRSHLALLAAQGNSLQRWWFAPCYQPLETNTDHTLFRITGPRAQLLSQEEIADTEGRRSDAAYTRRSTEKFAELFTEHFEALCDVSPEFAALQNLYDMALLAELIQQRRVAAGITWKPSLLLDETRLPLTTYPVPKFVPSAATHRKGARGVMVGLIGGVRIDSRAVANRIEVTSRLQREQFGVSDRGRVWWNAAALR
ncbi:MAG: DUF1598 domain-containing protein [Planctomycetaceae bacterium]|nr:DUF1598 domain-containing protein [Planctomycetaceae bacterium]